MPGAPVHAAERRIVRKLREAGALSPGAAEPLDDLWGVQRRRLPRMIARGVVHEASPGTYYLDEEAWDAYRAGQRRLALIMLAVAAAAALVMFALTGHAQAPAPAWDVARTDVPRGEVTQASVEDTQSHRARKL